MPSIYTGVEEQVIDQEENQTKITELKHKLSDQIRNSNRMADIVLKELI